MSDSSLISLSNGVPKISGCPSLSAMYGYLSAYGVAISYLDPLSGWKWSLTFLASTSYKTLIIYNYLLPFHVIFHGTF